MGVVGLWGLEMQGEVGFLLSWWCLRRIIILPPHPTIIIITTNTNKVTGIFSSFRISTVLTHAAATTAEEVVVASTTTLIYCSPSLKATTSNPRSCLILTTHVFSPLMSTVTRFDRFDRLIVNLIHQSINSWVYMYTSIHYFSSSQFADWSSTRGGGKAGASMQYRR